MASAKPKIEKSVQAFRSIGEAATVLGLEPHVLRYWEGKFPKHVRPVKRADGRRMFRPEDLDALKAIQILVRQRGMTLKGARALLTDQGVQAVMSGEARIVAATVKGSDMSDPVPSPARELQDTVMEAFDAERCAEEGAPSADTAARLRSVLDDITDLKRRLDEARTRRAA